MSSSGWGPGDPGQHGPQGGPPQGPGQQGGWQQPPPSQHPGHPVPPMQGGWGGQSSPPPGPGYGAPSGAPGPQGPGGPGQNPPPKRPWALIVIALGCVLALLLVVGGGLAFLVLRQSGGDEEIATGPPAQTETDGGTEPEPSSETPEETQPAETTPEGTGSDFEVVSPIDVPLGDVDDMWAVMEDNPLVEGTLPTVPECELPDTPIAPSDEELQAVLDASSTCLNRVWSTAHSDRGLPWLSPTVVVYTHPDIPSESACDSNFDADFPRMCNLDNTIYWPSGYGTALDLTDPANVPGTYLWDLAFIYTNAVTWQSSLAVYYSTMQGMLEEGSDEGLVDEAWRRYNLQMQCLASAASMQVPEGAQAPAALRESLTDPGGWSEGDPPRNISPENRAKWIERGFASGGELSACNTWTVEADEVS